MTEDVQRWLRDAERVRVLNSFDHAWNLADEQNRVVSVVTSTIGCGPLSIVLPLSKLPTLSEQASVVTTSDQLTTACLMIDFRDAVLWDATLPQPQGICFSKIVRLGRRVLHDSVDSLAQPYLNLTTSAASFQQQVMKTLSEAALAATRALIDEDDCALINAVESLAGKGMGFTPAGDDWLLGCIVALQSLRHPVKAARIAEAALPHTTPFSAASLKMAGKRKLAQPWHDLIKAGSSAQIHAAMLRLREHGHSSGADALTGFIQVLEALSPTPDRLLT